MTQQEQLILAFRNLPVNEQFDVTFAFLKELARTKISPISDDERSFLDTRIQIANDHPDRLTSASDVFRELSDDAGR